MLSFPRCSFLQFSKFRGLGHTARGCGGTGAARGVSQPRNWRSCRLDLAVPHLWATELEPGPVLVLNALKSVNPSKPSTAEREKPKKQRQPLWGCWRVIHRPHGPRQGISVGVCGGQGWKGLYVCTNSPWIGEGLTPRAWPGHRITLGCCQFEGWGSPLFVACGSKGEPLASTPIGHHVSRPYVKGGAVRGAGSAVARGHPAGLAAGPAGERCQAASAIQGLGAAGIAAGASRMRGKVVLPLLLLVCILGSALLAAVILCGRGEGCLRA